MGYPKHIVLDGVTYEARDQAHEDALRASVAPPVYVEAAPINAVEAPEAPDEPAAPEPTPKPKAAGSRKGKVY